MKRLFVVVCLCTLFSCQDRVVCPAFQSTYILDDSTRNAFFSYVWQLDEETRAQYLANNKNKSQSESEDTLQVAASFSQPKTDYYAYAGEKVVPWRVSKRTKYGIQKRVPYPIKNYRLRTAPMENVFGTDPISNNFVASDFVDSLSVDSTAIALDSLETTPIVAKQETKYLYEYDPNDNFNVDQEYYNKYFGEKFIDTRKRTPKRIPDGIESNSLPDSLQTKEPFFKRLFSKKEKSIEPEEDNTPDAEQVDVESSSTEPNEEEEENEEGQ
ncbi:MAG: hypothetical protein AB8B73_13160 [Ekhidna sp.]